MLKKASDKEKIPKDFLLVFFFFISESGELLLISKKGQRLLEL